jgi:hypothetical protein
MRKRLTAGLLVIGLSALSLTPAEAIFGLSKCEKATKAIIEEEKVGLESWKYFALMVKNHNKKSIWNIPLADALQEVYKSDKIVWEIARKNVKCYTPAQIAEIRRQLSYTNKQIADYKKLTNNPRFKDFSFDWSIYYKKYISAVAVLKEVKSLPSPTPSSRGKSA